MNEDRDNQAPSNPPDRGSDGAPAAEADGARSGMTVVRFLSGRGLTDGVQIGDAEDHPGTDTSLTAQDRKYKVLSFLAQGGMGAILKAHDFNARRSVAMKVMLKSAPLDQHQVVRFIEEAQVTGQLEHPNIVPVHELGVDANRNVFFTMKLVRGDTLQAVLGRISDGDAATIAEYPLTRLLTVFQKVCDAVSFAHAHAVVHRDLKPENIMIGQYGEVLVMDWGLAKIVSSAEDRKPGSARRKGDANDLGQAGVPAIESLRSQSADQALRTMDGQVMGTPAFMAPEQALGRIGDIGAHTDVYALGAILYHILALRPPVEGDTIRRVLLNVAKGKITPPAEYNQPSAQPGTPEPATPRAKDLKAMQQRAARARQPRRKAPAKPKARPQSFPHCPGNRIPSSLSAVTMKALALNPADRYQSVTELQADVSAWQGGFATSAEQVGPVTQLILLARRHKTETAIIAALMAVMLGVAGLFLVRLTHERNAAVQKEQQAQMVWNKLAESQAKTQDLQLQASRSQLLKAHAALKRGDWDAARAAATHAVELDVKGDLPEARYLLARLELGSLRFSKAIEALRQALDLDPHGIGSMAFSLSNVVVQFQNLAQRHGGRLQSGEVIRLAEQLEKRRDAAVAQRLLLALRRQIKTPQAQFRIAELLLRFANPDQARLEFRRQEEQDGIRLDVSGNAQLRDLSALEALPIVGLALRRTAVADLTPLRGMSLREIDLSDTAVTDLTPLAGMPLTRLRLDGCPVADLTPAATLADLTVLHASRTQVSDIDCLRGKALIELVLDATEVADIGVLRGMPLQSLRLQGCRKMHDLTLLRTCTTLRSLVLPPDHGDITFLRDLSDLAALGYAEPVGSAAEFWPHYDAGVYDLVRQLKARNRNYRGGGRFEVTNGRIVTAQLARQALRDLTPLRGLPLEHLALQDNQVHDLSALAGMPLQFLHLANNPVRDITVCRDMPLRELNLSQTQTGSIACLAGKHLEFLHLPRTPVADVSWLHAMPLRDVALHNCERLPNVQALRDAATLQCLALPAQARQIEFLRAFPNLRHLNTTWDGRRQTAEQFWAKYDALAAQLAQARNELLAANPEQRPLRFESTIVADMSCWLDLSGNAHLRDIKPVESLPLIRLDLSGTAVADLSALSSTPVQRLLLQGCGELRDLSPLGRCRTLRAVVLPDHIDAAAAREHMPGTLRALGGIDAQLKIALKDLNPGYSYGGEIRCTDGQVVEVRFDTQSSAGIVDISPLLACEHLTEVSGIPLDSPLAEFLGEAPYEAARRRALEQIERLTGARAPWFRMRLEELKRASEQPQAAWVQDLMRRGQSGEALALWKAMLPLCLDADQQGGWWLFLVGLLREAGDLDKAEKAVTAVLRRAELPASLRAAALVEQAQVFSARQRQEEAIAVLEAAARAPEAGPADFAQIASLARELGADDLADKVFAKGLLAGCVLRYVFEPGAVSDRGGGRAVTDLSGKAKHGLVKGASLTSDDGRTAMQFDGNGDYVDVPGFVLETGTASFLARIRREGPNRDAGIVFSRSRREEGGWIPCGPNTTNDGRLHYHWNNDDKACWGWSGGPPIPSGSWVTVAVVIEPDKATAYVGSAQGLEHGTNRIRHIVQRIDRLKLGWDEIAPRFFQGLMREAMVFDRALRPAEVAAFHRLWSSGQPIALGAARGQLRPAPSDRALETAAAALRKQNPAQEPLRFEHKRGDDGTLTVDVSGNGALSDISALEGLPFGVLDLSAAAVHDLAPLRTPPVARLILDGCTQLQDLAPLASCSQLAQLILPRHLAVDDARELLPKVEFIAHNTAAARLQLALREANPEYDYGGQITVEHEQVTGIRLFGAMIRDVSPMKGLPLKRFVHNGTPLPDVAPLLACTDLEQVTCLNFINPMTDRVGEIPYADACRRARELTALMRESRSPWFRDQVDAFERSLVTPDRRWIDPLVAKGDLDAAEAVCEIMLRLCKKGSEEKLDLRLLAATIDRDRGRMKEAAGGLESLLAQPALPVSHRGPVMLALADVYKRSGRKADAIAVARRILAQNSPDAVVPWGTAGLVRELGDEKLAREAASRIIPPGCVLWLSFDRDTVRTAGDRVVVTDLSGSGRNVTIVGAKPVADAGRDALDIRGAGDYVDCGADTALDLPNALTVSAWVKSRGGNWHLVNRGGGWNAPGYSLWLINGKTRIELKGPAQSLYFDNPSPATGEWHHLAFTWDMASKAVRLYLDGRLSPVVREFTGPIGKPVQNLNIGRNEKHIADSGQANSSRGLIDDVVLFSRALSAEEITALYDLQLRRSGGPTAERR